MEDAQNPSDLGADVPNAHSKLENSTPDGLKKLIVGVISLLENYGWIVVLCLVVGWFIFEKLKPYLHNWKNQLDEYHEKKNEDSEKISIRHEHLDIARRRMQEKIDADVARYKERQQVLETQRRREKIEDWDQHQLGNGYRSKTKAPDTNDPAQGVVKPKSQIKKSLRPTDYNPLTGQSSGSSYRAAPRRGQSGGG